LNRPTRHTAAGRAYLDLQNEARRTRRGTQELLTLYGVERWLARLSRSPYAADFILKGGMLLAAFGQRRPTVDVDTLARNIAADEEAVAARVAEIADLDDPDDGIEFLTDTLTTRTIRDEAAYAGVRVTMQARLATAVIKFSLDVNFGDPVTPAPQIVELPTLRPDTPPVQVLGYPIETVLAEKLTTAITLGPANTRVRDYADIHTLTGTHDLDLSRLREALERTAQFRDVTVQPLSAVVGDLADRRAATYTAYRRNLGPDGHHLPEQFTDVVSNAITFADPITEPTGRSARWHSRTRRWTAEPQEP
jgi:hypothetical protein